MFSGWREALLARLDAVKAPDVIDVPMEIVVAEGKVVGSAVWPMSPALYWSGVPSRYRHPERYVVQRRIKLELGTTRRAPVTEIVVRERDRGVVAWVSPSRPTVGTTEGRTP